VSTKLENRSAIDAAPRGSVFAVFTTAVKLGLTSFGGPIAHLGYFHEEYVNRKKWIDEQSYSNLVALCQFLPGPASSQVGIAMGIEQAGILGGIAAWLGFTLPSAIALVLFAQLLRGDNIQQAGWIQGLLIAAVAVVTQAVWSMATKLAPDKPRGTIALLAAVTTLLWSTALSQVFVLAIAALIGLLFLKREQGITLPPVRTPISRTTGVIAWIVFFGLLILLPVLQTIRPNETLAIFNQFYRAGALVFGGGHVVLPLLQHAVVPSGWMSNQQFLAGYGAAQAVPGPLFTFAAYLGGFTYGIWGALTALVAIFLPAFLLVVGALPFWHAFQENPRFQAALRGINAAVVGILLAALYNPVWTSAIKNPADFCLAIAAFGLLTLWKLPPWAVVLFAAVGGAVIAAV